MEENAGYAIARLDLGGSKCPAGVGSPKFSGKFKFEKDRVFQHLGFFGDSWPRPKPTGNLPLGGLTVPQRCVTQFHMSVPFHPN